MWEIRTEQQREQEAIERWGEEEWNRRKEVVSQKREELKGKSGWEVNQVVGTQFEAIARQLNQENWDKLTNLSVSKWENLVYSMAGVR